MARISRDDLEARWFDLFSSWAQADREAGMKVLATLHRHLPADPKARPPKPEQAGDRRPARGIPARWAARIGSDPIMEHWLFWSFMAGAAIALLASWREDREAEANWTITRMRKAINEAEPDISRTELGMKRDPDNSLRK